MGSSISLSVNLPERNATQEILPSPLLCKSEVLRWFGSPLWKWRLTFLTTAGLLCLTHCNFDSSVFRAYSWSWKKNQSVIISSSASLAALEKFKLTSLDKNGSLLRLVRRLLFNHSVRGWKSSVRESVFK